MKSLPTSACWEKKWITKHVTSWDENKLHDFPSQRRQILTVLLLFSVCCYTSLTVSRNYFQKKAKCLHFQEFVNCTSIIKARVINIHRFCALLECLFCVWHFLIALIGLVYHHETLSAPRSRRSIWQKRVCRFFISTLFHTYLCPTFLHGIISFLLMKNQLGKRSLLTTRCPAFSYIPCEDICNYSV